jgi:hypothetical protein
MAQEKKESAAERKPKTQKVVIFTDRPGLRLIQPEDWAGAGVKDHGPTLWGPANDWTVAKADLGLSDEQYARIILSDRLFREETREISDEE